MTPCDTPPYMYVQATRRIGYERPEDVRWQHLEARWRERWGRVVRGRACKLCRAGPPDGLERITFTLSNGREVTVWMSQCGRCLTVFWMEEPTP